MNKIFSLVLCISLSINSVGAIEAQNTTSGVVAQEKQLDSGEFSRFNRMLKWLEQNKGCLTGVSCSNWASFTANYMLGVAIQLGQSMIFSAARNVYSRGFKAIIGKERKEIGPILINYLREGEKNQQEFEEAKKIDSFLAMIEANKKLKKINKKLKKDLTGLADIAGILGELAMVNTLRLLTQKAIQLGYETIVTKTEPLSWRQTIQCLISGRGCTGDQRRKAFFTAGRASGFLGAIAYSRLSSRQKIGE